MENGFYFKILELSLINLYNLFLISKLLKHQDHLV